MRKVALSLTLFASLALCAPASANTLTVTDAGDSGAGTLRDQVAAANAGDTIDFTSGVAAGTITLASPIALDKNLTIVGAAGLGGGPTVTGIAGLFHVPAATTVTIRHLRIDAAAGPDGTTPDAGGNVIENSGDLTLEKMLIENSSGGDSTGSNTALAGGGGGGSVVASKGTLTIRESMVTGNTGGDGNPANNRAGAGAGGGVIASIGPLTIDSSTISGNAGGAGGSPASPSGGGGGGAGGAAVISSGTLSIVNSTLAGNTGGAAGVAFAGNSGLVGGAGGGGFGAGGGGSSFTGGSNTAGVGFFGNGGAGDSVTGEGGGAGGGGNGGNGGNAINSNFNGAAGGGPGGGAGGTAGSGDGGAGGGGDGGGGAGATSVFAIGAGGGTGGGGGSAGGAGGTGAGSGASSGGGGGTGNGAIALYGGSVTITNSTIAGNTASVGGAIASGSGSAGTDGAALVKMAGSTTINSSILADTASSGNQCRGAIDSGSNDLVEVPQGCSVPSDTLQDDPQLVALADNGGLVKTMALPAASPAFNAGSNPLDEAYDERGNGYVRTALGGTDIGAFELQPAYVRTTLTLNPASDPGLFNIFMNSFNEAPNAGNGADTGLISVTPGTVTVGELSGNGTDIANYDTAISCATNDGSGAAVSATSIATNNWSINVADSEQVRCTLTNTRNPAPTPTPTPPSSSPAAKPAITSLRATPDRPRRRAKNVTLSFEMSQNATLDLTVQRVLRGVKRGRKCVASLRGKGAGRHCTVIKTIATRNYRQSAGKAQVKYDAAKLAPGAYTFTLVARNANGSSDPARVTFAQPRALRSPR